MGTSTPPVSPFARTCPDQTERYTVQHRCTSRDAEVPCEVEGRCVGMCAGMCPPRSTLFA